jgi:hypothetical protein
MGCAEFKVAMKKMEEVRKLRMENLRALREAVADGNTALGGKSPQMLAQVMGPNPERTIGEDLARDLERILSLPYGYLDQSIPHD